MFANTTADTHPLHMHLVQFGVIERLPFNVDEPTQLEPAQPAPLVPPQTDVSAGTPTDTPTNARPVAS